MALNREVLQFMLLFGAGSEANGAHSFGALISKFAFIRLSVRLSIPVLVNVFVEHNIFNAVVFGKCFCLYVSENSEIILIFLC
jgi:hypothetical protein